MENEYVQMLSILQKNTLLNDIPDQFLRELLPELVRVELAVGDTLFQKGESGDGFYVIEAGTVRVLNDDIELNQLSVGDGFGEMSLLSGQTRSATILAVTAVTLIQMSRQGFLQLTAAYPQFVARLEALAENRIRETQLAHTLTAIADSLDTGTIAAITSKLRWETHDAGTTLMKQGELGDDMLLVTSGRIRVSINHGDGERVINEIGMGGTVGELSLFSGAARLATVQTIRRTTVAWLSQGVLQQLMRAHPAFVQQLLRTMAIRQQALVDLDHVEKPLSLNIALVPTQPGMDLTTFAEQLIPHLERFGTALTLDAERLGSLYDVPDMYKHMKTSASAGVVALWFNDLERRYTYVVYLLDYTWNTWTEWGVKHADRILFVADATSPPTPGELERQLTAAASGTRRELVLLHPPETEQPTGTAAWLEPRTPLYRHHHIRRDDGAHMARLARLLTGNGIGLVLGGGGARGYAHLGVLRALMEEQVPIDIIGCVSMGAVVGGALSKYMSYTPLQQNAALLGSKKALLDQTLPISALMRSRKVTEAMKKIYGDFNIEDAWLPFFCLSTNLSKACVNVHQHGKMYMAVRASLSIPGVFTPVVREGDLVVDGGVMNNYPVDIMRQMLEGGTVIGTLVTGTGRSAPYEILDEIDGWSAFWSRVLPWSKRKRVPSILKTILSSTSINSYSRMDSYRRLTDFLIETDPAPYGTMDFDRHAELTEKGYASNHDAIHAWAVAHQSLVGGAQSWPPTVKILENRI